MPDYSGEIYESVIRDMSRINIIVEGVTAGKVWTCGLEFDYANQETFHCRPLRISEEDGKVSARMPIPDEAGDLSIALLPPMSGLISNELTT